MTSKPRKQNKGTRMPPVEDTALRQSQQAQVQLDGAIRGVLRAESQLRDNSREARSALHSSISRQQESLRCREVFLLAQIDFLEHLKGETLQQQLQQLHWLKGQFDVITHQLEHSNQNHNLTNQLTSCLEKLSSFSLTPEETPEMSFHADTRSLKQTITSFGRIATQNMEAPPLSPTHQSPTSTLQTFPVTTKKQNMEVGPLSAWLLGNQPATGARPGFQSSQNPRDWLLSQKAEQPAPPPLASLDFMGAWGHLRDLEAWLLPEKTPVARERANSGTSSTCSSSFSIEKIDESELANMTLEEEVEEVEEEEEEEGFSMVEDELSDWLVTPGPGSGPAEPRADAERWKRVLRPFQESWLPGDWLQGSCSTCCQGPRPAVEIESLGKLKCLKTPPSPTPPPPSLSPSPTPSPPLELWLQQACRANEPCSSFSQCVCEQNCGSEVLSTWLLLRDGRDKNGVAKNTPPAAKLPTMHHAEQEHKVQAILEAWLHPSRTPSPARSPSAGEEKASREERSAKASPCPSLFQRPLQAERWVAAPQPEEDKWLLRKRSQAQERLGLPTVCDLFSCMKIGDKEKWLHKAPEQM